MIWLPYWQYWYSQVSQRFYCQERIKKRALTRFVTSLMILVLNTSSKCYFKIRTLRSEKRGKQRGRRYMKIYTLSMRKDKENPFAKFCCTRRTLKVSSDLLMKPCNILWKTLFNITQLFSIFFLKDWACIKCFACFLGSFTFFGSKQCRARLEKLENESILFCEWVFSLFVCFVVFYLLF